MSFKTELITKSVSLKSLTAGWDGASRSIVSLLGNARHSGTYAYFKKQLQEMAA